MLKYNLMYDYYIDIINKRGGMWMLIVLVRHGIAQELTQNIVDEERNLTTKGVKKFKKAAKGIGKLLEEYDKKHLWTSPFVRAHQTAKIIAETLNISEITTYPFILDGNFSKLSTQIKSGTKFECLIIVGHEPTMSEWSKQLCGIALPFKKGAAAAFSTKEEQFSEGRLLWFHQPKQLIALASVVKIGFAPDAHSKKEEYVIPDPEKNCLDTIQYAIGFCLRKIEKSIEKYESNPEDIENLHDLRVWTRHIRSVFSFAKPIVKSKKYKTLQTIFRKFIQKTEGLRNLDVFIESWIEFATEKHALEYHGQESQEDPKRNPLVDPKQKPLVDPKQKPLEDPKQKPLVDPKPKPLEDPKQKPLEDPKQQILEDLGHATQLDTEYEEMLRALKEVRKKRESNLQGFLATGGVTPMVLTLNEWLYKEKHPKKSSIGQYSEERFSKWIEKILMGIPKHDKNRIETIHPTRIRIKKLRYASEYFSNAILNDKARQTAIFKEIQDYLGKINDIAVFRQLSEKWPGPPEISIRYCEWLDLKQEGLMREFGGIEKKVSALKLMKDLVPLTSCSKKSPSSIQPYSRMREE